MADFNTWLETFIEEKGINTGRAFDFVNDNGVWNLIPLEVVIEFIKQLPKEQKNKIKTTIVKIDFMNGNVYHYFEYLAKGISLL